MIHQINVAKLSGYTQVDSLLQEMLLGGQENPLLAQSLHTGSGAADNGLISSPPSPSSPGSPPALALVNHHPHPAGAYVSPLISPMGFFFHFSIIYPAPYIKLYVC